MFEKRECSICASAGEKPKVSIGMRSLYHPSAPVEPYYDELGRYHWHDINRTVTVFRCANGHTWEGEPTRLPCPTFGCEWEASLAQSPSAIDPAVRDGFQRQVSG